MSPLCQVCLEPIESPDGLSFICDECGRSGFCWHCAEVGQHDCDPWPFWVADPDPAAADPDDWETELGEEEGLIVG